MIKSPKDIILQILNVLQIPEVSVDIMKVSDFAKKPGPITDSLVVSFKGNHVKDFVLETRRSFDKLTYPMILGQGTDDDIIYLNEFLPQNAYSLLRADKKKKAQVNWDGYIWVQETRILARKGQDKSNKPFEIKCMADVDAIA